MPLPPYSDILVATDGSPRAGRAARLAAGIARKTGARLTALYVVQERVPNAFTGTELYASPALGGEPSPLLRTQVQTALAAVELEARRAGVACASVQARSRHPWQAILRVARRHSCELIVMASHRREPATAALFGSQTTQVLARSKIPVLVCR